MAEPNASDCWGYNCPKMEQLEPPTDVQLSQAAREIAQIIINKRRSIMAKYAYVRVPADGYPEIVDKEEKIISWKETSDAVGGYIEIVKSADRDLWIVCNDEGNLRDLPVNSFATQLYGIPEDYIAGDVIICGQGTNKDGEPDIIPLPIDIAVDVWSKAYVSYQGVRIWQLLHSSKEN